MHFLIYSQKKSDPKANIYFTDWPWHSNSNIFQSPRSYFSEAGALQSISFMLQVSKFAHVHIFFILSFSELYFQILSIPPAFIYLSKWSSEVIQSTSLCPVTLLTIFFLHDLYLDLHARSVYMVYGLYGYALCACMVYIHILICFDC